MKTSSKFIGVVACAMSLAGCASINPLAGTQLTTGFPERAMEVNDAYRAERNAQILVNILRARDRQDRKYTSLSDLKLTPSADVSNTAKVGGLELGQAKDPWALIEASRTAGNKSNLELTISPNAKSDTGSIYRTPITQDQFQFYWNSSWSKDLLTELMIAKATPLFLVSNPGNTSVLDGIVAARRGFRVFAGDGELAHCFSNDQCEVEEQKAEKAPAAAKAPKGASVEPAKLADDKKEKTYQFTIKAKLPTATSILPGERRPVEDLAKLMESPNGRLLFCRRESAEMPVTMPDAKGPKMREAYRCGFDPISPAACSKTDKDGKCEQGQAVSLPISVFFVAPGDGLYTIALNSIDDAIYKVGRSLRSYEKWDGCRTWMAVCSNAPAQIFFNSEDEETVRRANALKPDDNSDAAQTLKAKAAAARTRKVPLFALATKDSLGKSFADCSKRFAAATTLPDGRAYYAGPPQAFAYESPGIEEPDPSKERHCYLQDRTGTVLTLIAELIELNQVPVKLTPSLLFRE